MKIDRVAKIFEDSDSVTCEFLSDGSIKINGEQLGTDEFEALAVELIMQCLRNHSILFFGATDRTETVCFSKNKNVFDFVTSCLVRLVHRKGEFVDHSTGCFYADSYFVDADAVLDQNVKIDPRESN